MPPKGLGLRWMLIGEKNTRNGPRVLWNSPGSKVFDLVWRRHRSALHDLGFSYDYHQGGIAFWERPEFDTVAARSKMALIVLSARYEDRTKRAKELAARRKRAEEAARLKAEMEVRRLAAQEGIQRILSERRWAIHHRYLDEAMKFSELPELDPADVARAERIIQSTDRTVQNAREALDLPPPADDRAFCEKEEIRLLVTQALRGITDHDADWATYDNDIGWSKATTVIGHVLSLEDALSIEHAAHALKILRVHHKQVDPTLRGALRLTP
jgi:hypothetical protein